MKNFKQIENDVTGEVQLQGPVMLAGELSEQTFENSNGKEFKLVDVVIETKSGAKSTTAQVYAGNYEHPEANFIKGQSYLATISKGDGRGVLVQMSHLTAGGSRISADEFDFEAVEEKAPLV